MSKGGRRGLNLSSSAADKQKIRLAEKKRKRAVAEQISANEKLVKQLCDQWLAQKGQAHHERLVLDEREKASPLAAALRAAIKSKEEAGD